MSSEHEEHESAEGILVPKPTGAPMLVALGITMLFAGLVTNAIVTFAGIPLVLFGGIFWWRGVLPQQQEVLVPFQTEAERAPPIVPDPQAVAHLIPGEAGHRVRVPAEIHPYTAGLAGGAAGGIAMAIIAMAYGLYSEGSIWYPVNLLASIMLPSLNEANVAQLSQFHWTGLVGALIIHAGLSLMVGSIYGVLLPMLPGRPLLWAGIFAPLIWTGVIWVCLAIVSPALDDHVEWGWFVGSQIAFGLVAGWVVTRSEPIKTMQTWSLAERAGVEATGITPRGEDDS